MAQRKLQTIPADDLSEEWVQNIETIYKDTVGLFWKRKVFRNVSRVFKGNVHLQEVGGDVWAWMTGNYVSGDGPLGVGTACSARTPAQNCP